MRTFLHYARQITEDIEPCNWTKRQAREWLKIMLTPKHGYDWYSVPHRLKIDNWEEFILNSPNDEHPTWL